MLHGLRLTTPRVLLRVLPLLLLAGGLAPRAGADAPLPPPARHSASSLSGRAVAVSDPSEGLTTVTLRGADGGVASAWSMAGWYRALHVADDGEHLVLGYDGLNLLPASAQADLVLLRFVRRGEVLRVVRLRDLVPDPTRLRRTASHLLWREAEGFAPDGTFAVLTVDGVKHVFDPATGLPPAAATHAPASDLDTLCAWMAGSFSSSAQAAADPGTPKDYRDVTLHIAPIWTKRSDGRWFYVEQALTPMPEAPYRQRVYRVRALLDGLFESRVYELPEAKAAVGAWKEQAPLAALMPEVLVLREGCGVLLRRLDASTFAGSTLGSQCATTFQGAVYVSSEVTVTSSGLRTWDRGFDAAGQQVWGATKGPYEFRRL